MTDACLPQNAENFALEEWIELSNGCLCCSVKTEMVQALETLMERRHKFDYILIETTGGLAIAVVEHAIRQGKVVCAQRHALGASIRLRAACWSGICLQTCSFAHCSALVAVNVRQALSSLSVLP